MRSPVVGPLLRDLDTTALARQGLQASFAEPALATEDMVQRYVRLARAPGHRAILLQITLGFRERNFASAERLAPLSDLPTLILQGGQDRLVPADHARLFAQAIPGSSLVFWEEVGHLPQEEIPSVSVAALRTFLAARTPELDAQDGAPSAVAPAP
jgi:pimeloyl-ACP methyl ester carboxylesterase